MKNFVFEEYLKPGRNKSVDFLKLYAALLVILGHCLIQCVETGGQSNPLYNYIWLTQMPLFMFLSGFVNHSPEKIATLKDYFYRLSKNALVLLVPCLTYLLIDCLVCQSSLIDGLANLKYGPTLWFLWALFVIHVIFDFGLYLSNKVKCNAKPILPIAVGALFSATIGVLAIVLKGKFDSSILCLKLIAYYFPFYCFGFLFYTVLPFISKFKKTCFVAVIFAFVILMFLIFYFESIYAFEDLNLKFVVIRVLGSISSIFVALALGNYAVKLKPLSWASKFGAFSLQSYYLHCRYLSFIHLHGQTTPIQFLFAFLIFFILIALVIVSMIGLYFIPCAHLVLFGKSFSKYSFEKKLPKILR